MISKISIITPLFNRASDIQETAASILNQTNPNWEWLITDDGSTDDSWNVASRLAEKDSRIKIFKREREPKGACTCRNISIANSTGNFLIFLDSDDLLAPHCVDQRLAEAEKFPDVDFIIFPMLLFRKEPHDMNKLWNIDKPDDDIDRILRSDPVCQGTGTIWKKEKFVEIGGWNEHLRLWQDVELHLRAMLNGCTFRKNLSLPPDVYLRISDTSLSRTGYYSIQKLESRLSVFTYVFRIMTERGIISDYRSGLRFMCRDLLLNIINSGYSGKLEELLQLVKGKLFTAKEEKTIRSFALVRRLKLTRIPAVKNYYVSKLMDMEKLNSTMGKIDYTEPQAIKGKPALQAL